MLSGSVGKVMPDQASPENYRGWRVCVCVWLIPDVSPYPCLAVTDGPYCRLDARCALARIQAVQE
jgi:hypothetical protein